MSLLVEKGSVTINGTSLTVFNLDENRFTVAIIPYTLEHTTIKDVQQGTSVNLEYDILGKYVARISNFKNA
jgi:riboflavin synthase